MGGVETGVWCEVEYEVYRGGMCEGTESMEVGCVRVGGVKVECVNVGVWSNYIIDVHVPNMLV